MSNSPESFISNLDDKSISVEFISSMPVPKITIFYIQADNHSHRFSKIIINASIWIAYGQDH